MQIKDLFSFSLASSAAASQVALTAETTPAARPTGGADMDFVSSAWLISQAQASKNAPGGRRQSPAEYVAAPKPKSYPIYVSREPASAAEGGIGAMKGLRVTQDFFDAFTLPVQWGLIMGLGQAAQDQSYLQGMTWGPNNGNVTCQTYGQNVSGRFVGPRPNDHVVRNLGKDLAAETQKAWESYLKEHDLNPGADF